MHKFFSGRLLSGASTNVLRLVWVSGISLAALTAGASTSAIAADDANASATIETVVVTARHTEENVQNVPLAITALSAETLTAASAHSLEDLTFLTPGLTYTSNGAESDALPVIRGLSDTSGGEASSSNVSVFLDGIYIADPSAIDLGLGGLQRVEVVKGPVSGLYGRNAFAGAINYVTAPPTADFHTDDAVTVGDYGREIVEAGVSGSILNGDMLTGRVAATYDNIDGTFKDPISGVRGNGHEKADILASLQFKPDDHITVYPVFYYGHDIFTSPTAVTYAQNCAFGNSNSYCGSLNNNQIGPFLASNAGANVTGNTRKVVHAHVDTRFEYSWGSIDVLAGFNDIKNNNINEFDGTEFGELYALYLPGANNPFAGNPTVGTALAKEFFGARETERDISVEARYDSPREERFRFSFGGYFYNHIQTLNNTFGIDGANIPAGDVLNFIAQGYVTSAGQSAGDINAARGTTRDYSGFVSADFDILPDLTLSTALRFTSEDNAQVSGSCPAGKCAVTNDNLTSNSALTWKPTSDLTLYVSAANGAKAGGFNGAALGAADIAYGPEKDWDYEAGVKTSVLDDHLKLDFDIFHTDLSNLQVLGPPKTPGAIGLVVTNFGSLKANGAELQADYADESGLAVSTGVAYTDPRFTASSLDFSDAASCAAIPSCAATRLTTYPVGGVPTPTVQLKGLRPPFESDWTFNTSIGYHQPLGLLDGVDWFVRGDYRFESKQFDTVDDFAYVAPRNVFNLHAGLENDNWTLTGYVLNFANDRTPVTTQSNAAFNGFDAPPIGTFGINWIPTSVLPDGRTYAFRLAYHY